MAELTSVA